MPVPDKDQLKELTRLKLISRQRLSTVVITAGLILLLSVSFFLVSGQLRRYCNDFCFYLLHREAQEIKKDINRDIAFFRNDMDALSRLLEGEKDLTSEYVTDLLKAYEKKEMISQLGIMFPDNQVLKPDGTFVMSSDEISFELLDRQAPFFSNIRQDDKDPDRRILYYAIPIEQEGSIRGVLFGIIKLDFLSKDFEVSLFGEEISISIVDSENMDVILANLHGSHGEHGGGHSTQDVGDLHESGRFSYLIPKQEESMYSLCEPMDISGWSLLLSIPERIVLDAAQYIGNILFRLGMFQSIIFLSYFIWVLLRTKRETRFKESEVRHIYYMYNVQQILFDAYRKPENIVLSLEEIARTLGAKGALLASVAGDSMYRAFIWQDEGESGDKNQKKQLAKALVQDMVKRQEGYTAAAGNALGEADDGLREILSRFAIERLTAIPIEGREDQIVGVLAVIDGDERRSMDCLTSVAFSFSMALDNICAYETIEKMGTTDALTCLKNRNSYEELLRKYETDRPDCLTCVYADANGLHELNNSQGHEAGDKMLKSVARALAEEFEDGSVFRIGGDEFLVFTDMAEEAAAGLAAEVKGKVKEQGYHVSVGTASGGREVLPVAIVKTAEQMMYEDKRQYYLGSNDRRKMR